jgi:hypothetical protein
LSLNLLHVGLNLLAVEFILFQEVVPLSIADLLPAFVLDDLLAKTNQLVAVLFQHLALVGSILSWVCLATQVHLSLSFSLQQHLLQLNNVLLVLLKLGWKVRV